MLDSESLPYHNDGDRLYYNTGNKINVEKRTRERLCQAGCTQLVDVPPNSLQGSEFKIVCQNSDFCEKILTSSQKFQYFLIVFRRNRSSVQNLT